MNSSKYTIVIVDDEQKYWVDNYTDLSKLAKTIRYEFANKEQLLEWFKTLPYEGNWYFLIDKRNNTIISGACDPDDYEYIKEL